MMNDGSEGWRMIRCAGGVHDKSVMNRRMLKFRPIAPKPEASGSDVVSGRLGCENSNKSSLLSKGLRKKRKYVRVRRNSGYSRKKKPAISREDKNIETGDVDRTETLQLLPEKSDLNRSMTNGLDLNTSNRSLEENRGVQPIWLNWKKPESSGEQTMVTDRVLVVHTWVTVECVTGDSTTCMNNDNIDVDHHHQGFGSTDVERVRNLEEDTCPGFISDGSNTVMWVNGAFRRMVVSQLVENNNDGLSPEIMVGLVIKEKLPSFYSSFTGLVKLQYTLLGGGMMEKYSRIVPCDLWRMDGGGFAWRLDVEAALTLGR